MNENEMHKKTMALISVVIDRVDILKAQVDLLNSRINLIDIDNKQNYTTDNQVKLLYKDLNSLESENK